jgi:hypothetical protein
MIATISNLTQVIESNPPADTILVGDFNLPVYKGDSRIFLEGFLTEAAVGSFLLGGSGGMPPQKNFEN